MIKYLKTMIFTMLGMASCTDDLMLSDRKTEETGDVLFTASIAQQDFYGNAAASNATRAAEVRQHDLSEGFYDLSIVGNNDLKLGVTTVGGIFGKPNDFADKGVDEAYQGRATRGAMLTELRQESMLVLETSRTGSGVTVGEPYKATTSDGVSWTGSHVKDNGKAIQRTLNAFYPYRETYSVSSKDQTLTYTVPETATEQCDLLFARHEQGIASEQTDSLHLTFNHLLTAVRFKVGRQELPMSVITRIEISGIHNQGTFDCNTNAWTSVTGTGTATATLNFNITGMSNTVINSGENTFMLLPQELPAGAKVTLYYSENGKEEQLTAQLSSSTHTPVWKPGQSITYTLMTKAEDDEYVLEVEQPEAFTHEGGTHNINILSYKRQGDVLTPVKWAIQSYSGDGGYTWMDGGNANAVKGLALSAGEGYSDQPMLVGVTVAPAEKMENVPHAEILRYTPALGQNGEPFDLSTHDYLNQPCLRNTANCYVVDAPGTYSFPTAYGNGIVNGETNSRAYADGNFVDANGKQISAPMIQQSNGMKINRAALVWQDSEDLIRPEDIQLIDGGNAIQFTIRPEHIAQGNATIAALDGSNKVLWSWHIWVTDDKAQLAETIDYTTESGDDFSFMPLNIGWCSTVNCTGYVGRELAVRITQPEEALHNRASIRVLQHSSVSRDNMSNFEGNATYYNWGRKDPFPGAETNKDILGDEIENTDSQPKHFYQAGSEAGTLGLHAETNVEYGPNLGYAAAQGVLIGANGFLTGYSIGSLIKSLTKMGAAGTTVVPKDYEMIENEFVLVGGQEMEKGATRISFAQAEKNLLEQGFTQVAKPDFVTSPLNGMSSSYFMKDGMYYNLMIRNQNYLLNVISTYNLPTVLDIENLPLMVYCAQRIAVPAITSAVATGSYASVIVGATAAALAATSIGVGEVFAASSLFSGDGEWLREVKGHGHDINYGITHPHVLFRNPIGWTNASAKNLWNATQGSEDSRNESVTKTVYDPSPAGYCVPPAKAFKEYNDTTTIVGSYNALVYKVASDKALILPALGYRFFWSGSPIGAAAANDINQLITFNGGQGFYWTASPAIEEPDEREGGYCLNFKSSETYTPVDGKTAYAPRVENDLKLQTSFAMPIRPIREK